MVAVGHLFGFQLHPFDLSFGCHLSHMTLVVHKVNIEVTNWKKLAGMQRLNKYHTKSC